MRHGPALLRAYLADRARPLAALALAATLTPAVPAVATAQPRTSAARPVFENGQAQVVPAFQDSSSWIREELWVETELDTDGDGRRDRVHVAVVRPGQTETEGLKVPVVYESSPYYSGTSGARRFLWDVRQELGAPPPPRESQPPVRRRIRPHISNSHVDDWVPRGFAVVHSEAPGTGLSQGCPTVGDDPEALAPKAVIDWLNGRARGFASPDGDVEVAADWSTGRVGMTGTSYNGTLAVAAASTGVEGLEAIIPVAPNNSYYLYYRQNGLVVHPGGWLGEDIDFLYDFVNSGDPERRAYCNRTIRDGEMAAGRDRVTGDFNDFWAEHHLLAQLDDVRAATLMSHAFNDWNVKPEHSVRAAAALKARGVPVQYYFHQGGHGGPPPFELMNRWFTRYLYGIENGVEDDPGAWIVREGDERSEPTPYPDYPHPGAVPVTLRPTPGDDGPAGLNGVGGLEMAGGAVIGASSVGEPARNGAAEPASNGEGGPGSGVGEPVPNGAGASGSDGADVPAWSGVGGPASGGAGEHVSNRGRAPGPPARPGQLTETLIDNVSFDGASLARAEWTDHRLLYATPPLAEPVHISGTPRVTIRLAASKPAANLSVWLVALPWTGGRDLTDDLITRGWADPQNRESLRDGEPLVPGRFYDVTFDLQPDDQVIPAGQRIGLMIFSSDRDFTLWPAPGTELTVDLAGTSLELPVVGGAEALRRAVEGVASDRRQ